MPKKKKRKLRSKKTIPLNVKAFTDYIKTKDKPTFDSIGNTTIIPTAVIESIKKIN